MRITSAVNGIERAFRWTEQELATTKTRGNYGTTIAAVDKMLEQARQIVENLEKIRNGESGGGTNHGDKQDKQSDKDITNPDTFSKLLVGTIDALNKMGVLHWNMPNSAQTDPHAVPAETRDEVMPKLEVDVVKKSDVSVESKKKERKDWGKILKKYHIAVDSLKTYTFKAVGGAEFASYLKRWFDTLRVGFKQGVKLAMDKLPKKMYDFAFVFATHWDKGTMSEFENMFLEWENGVKYRGLTYATPAEIGSIGERLPDMYAETDTGFDIMYEIINGPMHSLSMDVCGRSPEYLSVGRLEARLCGDAFA